MHVVTVREVVERLLALPVAEEVVPGAQVAVQGVEAGGALNVARVGV